MMKIFGGIFMIYSFTVWEISNCEEVFSSIDSLHDLAVNFEKITENLANFSKVLKSEYVDSKVREFRDENESIKSDIKNYIINPLNAFKMIKLTYNDIEMLHEIYPEEFEEFEKKIDDFRPTPNDLLGAVDGLIRLQEVYRFTTEDFSKGIIDNVTVRHPLTIHDLYVIATVAMKLEEKDFFTQEYLELALKRLTEDENHHTIEIDHYEIDYNLAVSYNRTGDYEHAIEISKWLLTESADSEDIKKLVEDATRLLNEKHQPALPMNPYQETFIVDGNYHQDKEAILFSQVCRGKLQQPLKVQAKLFCRYISKSPYTKLVKSKIEELHLKPYIILYHDVVSEKEVEELKVIGRPHKMRGQIINADGSDNMISNSRTSQVAWLPDEKFPLAKKISQRIQAMTGLSMLYSEHLQLQNYGVGGHYIPHFDHWRKNDGPYGGDGINRIATFLIYLNAVEKGGYTAFPYHKLRIPVVQRGAAFWYNLKPSGDSDSSTRHASCPVIIGNKWVANKWITLRDQMFRRPCLPLKKFVEEELDSYFKGIF